MTPIWPSALVHIFTASGALCALFAIRAMSDETNGRINEIDILPPPEVVSGSVTNLTVAGFFKSILTVMGVDENDVQYGDGSTELIGSLSTDNSSYVAVLSDSLPSVSSAL